MSVVPGRQCADLVWPLQIQLQQPSRPSFSPDRGPVHGFFPLLSRLTSGLSPHSQAALRS